MGSQHRGRNTVRFCGSAKRNTVAPCSFAGVVRADPGVLAAEVGMAMDASSSRRSPRFRVTHQKLGAILGGSVRCVLRPGAGYAGYLRRHVAASCLTFTQT